MGPVDLIGFRSFAFLRKLSAGVAAFLLVGAAISDRAQAQDVAPFPCAEVAAALTTEFADPRGIDLVAPSGAFEQEARTFIVDETPAVDGRPQGEPFGGALVEAAPFAQSGPGRCLFLMPAFSENVPEPLPILFSAGEPGIFRSLPVLILYRMDERFVPDGEVLSPEEQTWVTEGYPLDYSLEDLEPLAGEKIPLSDGNFRIRGLFNIKSADQRVFNLTALLASKADAGWAKRLRFGDDAILDRLLVLCFPTSCDDFLGGRPVEGGTGEDLPSTDEVVTQDLEVDGIRDQAKAAPGGISAAEILALTRLELESLVPGEERWEPIIGSASAAEKFRAGGGLPCLLHAMDPRLFHLGDGIACDAVRLESWRDRLKTSAIVFERPSTGLPAKSGAIARIYPNRRSTEVAVERIEVQVPADGSDRGCSLSAIYEAGTVQEPLQRTIELSRSDAGDRILFAADLDENARPLVRGGAVSLHIAVLGEDGCRLESRNETVRVANPVLSLQITPKDIEFRNLVYLPLFNAAGLDAEFSTTPERRVLADAMVMAIASAHRRLSARVGDGNLRINRADVMLFDAEAIDLYASLDLVRLRNLSEVNETFRGAEPRKLQDAAGRLFAPDPSAIARFLGQHYGSDRLSQTIVLIEFGHWVARGDADKVCDPLRLQAIQYAVGESTGKQVQIYSFPMMRLAAGDDARVAGQILPQGYVPARGHPFREVVACRQGAPGIAIYPFLAPDWYGVEELAYRYGTAVGDHLGGLLEDVAIVSRGDTK